MSDAATERVEQFSEAAAEYGVTVTPVESDPREGIAAAIEEPAVGVPLPFSDAELPGSVTTNPTPAELEAATTGVTAAAGGVADYGSVVLRGDGSGTEPVSLFVERHVAVLPRERLLADMPAAFEWFGDELREGRDSFVLATGPSATADMGALVQGAHGPETVEVILL